MITQEAITAEINYRMERAAANALAAQVRQARPSRLRRWLRATRVPRSDVASPAFKHTEFRFRANPGVHGTGTRGV